MYIIIFNFQCTWRGLTPWSVRVVLEIKAAVLLSSPFSFSGPPINRRWLHRPSIGRRWTPSWLGRNQTLPLLVTSNDALNAVDITASAHLCLFIVLLISTAVDFSPSWSLCYVCIFLFRKGPCFSSLCRWVDLLWCFFFFKSY